MKIRLERWVYSGLNAPNKHNVGIWREVDMAFVPPFGSNLPDGVIERMDVDYDSSVMILLNPDDTFCHNRIAQDYYDTDEFKDHIQEYLKNGWKKV